MTGDSLSIRIGTFKGIKIFQATPTKQDVGTNLVPRAFFLTWRQEKALGTRLSWYLLGVLFKISDEHYCKK